MVEVIDTAKALGYVSGYFDHLTAEGYVKPSTQYRFLVYLFIVDFVETVYPYITDADYNMIDKFMLRLFGQGDCLLPYHIFCGACQGHYPAVFGDDNLRASETGNLRAV